MHSLYFLILSCIYLLLANCNKEVSSPCEAVDYVVAFEAQAEKSYCLPDGTQIRVDSLVNALCPCNARCVWAGEILAYITVERGDEQIAHTIRSEKEDDPIDRLVFNIEAYTFVEECSGRNVSPEVATVSLLITQE
jgi:hypothetical protein